MPFAALAAPDGRFLAEHFELAYLPCPRFLLGPGRSEGPKGDGVLILANPTDSNLLGSEAEAEDIAALFPDASEALRLAQLDVIGAGREHPYYWAAFKVVQRSSTPTAEMPSPSS